MGCGGSKSGPSFQDDVGPDGPLSAAPSQLLVTGHVQTEHNGIYTRALQPWNGKAMYSNGLRYLYYYNENEGGAPSWSVAAAVHAVPFCPPRLSSSGAHCPSGTVHRRSLDHRDQPQTMGAKDWCAGGHLSLHGGPAYPPLCTNIELNDVEGCDHDVFVTITELEPLPPPAAVSLSGHPLVEANGIYSLAGDLWNDRPHYHSREGWCLYYYARNEGGAPGWSLHSENVPQGARDECDGGWVGPHTWAGPPLGEDVGFNEAGRVAVRAVDGDAALAAQVHALMVQHRQALWQAHGLSYAPVTLQPTVMVQQPVAMQPVAMAMAQPVVAQPMAMPMGMCGPVVARPVMAQPVAAQPVVAQPAC